MAFAYLLLALLPLAALAYIIWNHRRKTAAREAASAARMGELLGVAANVRREDRPVPAESPAAEQAPVEHASSHEARERLLSPQQTLLYYLLRTALPDYVVFAQMPVSAILEVAPTLAPYAREEQARIFARHVVDFVVSDKSTRPVAVVKLKTSGDIHQGALSSTRTWFAAAGVRYVEIDSTAMPRKETVRALVIGREVPDAMPAPSVISS